jgi:hypothetical protein
MNLTGKITTTVPSFSVPRLPYSTACPELMLCDFALKIVPRKWQQPYGRRTTVRMSKCALPASVSVLLCMLKLNSMLCCSKSVPYGFLLLLAASITVLLLCLGNRAPFSAANPPSEMGNPSPILALSQSLKFSWKE